MPSVAAVLVDFDGTACAHDVAFDLLTAFGADGWARYDDDIDAGRRTLREGIAGQAAMIRADDRTLLAYALDHCRMDPTFRPFVDRCSSLDVPVTLVSDGFGFYIHPLLEKHGIDDVTVVTNTWGRNGLRPELTFGNGHPSCVGCGTCKMQAVVAAREALGPVAFVGDGSTDRYAALYADVVFAKRHLAATCERDGVPFVPWETFDDVLASLASAEALPGPVAPLRCPGWTPA